MTLREVPRCGRETVPHQLGAWLRAQRRSRGWDVPEMARQLGRAAGSGRGALPAHQSLVTYVRRWERGANGVTERYLLLYCTAFRMCQGEFWSAVHEQLHVTGGDTAASGAEWARPQPARSR